MKLKNLMFGVGTGALFVALATMSACSKSSTSAPPAVPTITSVTPSPIIPGGTATITGTNFTSAATIAINGVTYTTGYSFVSATEMTAIIPTTTPAGTYSIVITVGTQASSPYTVTVGTSGPGPVDGYTSSNQVMSTNLIAYWPFDGSSSESNSGLPPTLKGGTATYVTGRIGQAVQLTNGWFTYPSGATAASGNNTGNGSNDTLSNGFTVSLWTNQLPDTSTLTTLFQLSFPNVIVNWPIMGIQYRKHADSTVDFDGGFSNVDASGPTVSYAALFTQPAFKDTGSWAFIAMVYDTTGGRNLRYYYNGVQVAVWNVGSYFVSSATEPLQLLAPNYASIGCAEGMGYTPGSTTGTAGYMAYGITATIDDIRFFNATLSAQKLSDLYQLGSQGR